MNITIEISVAIIAFAFLGLVIYLIFVLNEFRSTLKNLNKVIATMEPQLNSFANESTQLANTTNHIALDVQKKLEAFDPLFKSVSNIGEGIEQRTSYLNRKRCDFERTRKLEQEHEAFEHEEQIYKIVDFIELGIIFWQTLKKRS